MSTANLSRWIILLTRGSFGLETLNSHTQYFSSTAFEREQSDGSNAGRQYEGNLDRIFDEQSKTGHPRILNEKHRKAILECIDENPLVVLDDVMKHLGQIFIEL